MITKERLLYKISKQFNISDFGNKFPVDQFIPIYHTVSDCNLPHIKNVVLYKNSKEFENDLDFYLKHFEFLTWSEFKSYKKGEFITKKKAALMTFDDGLAEFADVVVPILEKKGISCIQFINPCFIGNTDIMFRHKVSILIDRLSAFSTIPDPVYELLKINKEQRNAQTVIKKLYGTSYTNRAILNELAHFFEINYNDYLKNNKIYLNQDDLFSLINKGFHIGAHSWDHPYYSELSINDQLETTLKSLSFLNNHKLPSDAFAFPFSDISITKEFFHKIFSRCPELLYTFGTCGIREDAVKNNLQRIIVENKYCAEDNLKKYLLSYKIRKAVGKGKLPRK